MIAKDINRVVRKGDVTKIENYDKAIADKSQVWECHHRLELTLEGEFAHTSKELIRMGMYYHRPYFELIFLTRAEHNKLHGTSRSEKHKKKISEAKKGKNLSEETRKKISEKLKNKSHTEFGRKYIAHFGYTYSANHNQYQQEYRWYNSHNHKCSWEKEE